MKSISTDSRPADSVTAPADQQTGDDIQRYKESAMQVWFRPARMHGHPERTPIKATITKDRGNGIVDLTYDDGEFSGNARAVPNALRLPRNVREQVAVWWDVGFEMDFQTAVDNSLKKKKDGLPPQPTPPAPSATAHVGDSLFESWFSEYNSAHRGTKQQMRDAYAAGMGDPKAQPSPTPQADSQPAPVAQGDAEQRQMDAKHAAIYRWMLSNVPDAWNIINNWCLYAEAGTDELHDALAARAQAKEGAQHG